MYALPQTPRARPPAQARRSNAAVEKALSDLTMPPPYSSSATTPEHPNKQPFTFPSLPSPVTATAELVGMDVTGRRQVTMSLSHGTSYQSREELKKLLSQTEMLIQDRERDLTVAATVGKALLDTNLLLKMKYDAVLARLPATPVESTRSHRSSQSLESWSTDDESFQSPDSSDPLRATYQAHARRISASPQALAFLQEQNEELLSQLAQIESETSEASHAGKLKLRQLEKEISGLRAELDASRDRAGELEETVLRERKEEERLRLKKEEREERAQAIRHQRSQAATVDKDAPVQDFAPGNRLGGRNFVFGMTTPDRDYSDQEPDTDVFGRVAEPSNQLGSALSSQTLNEDCNDNGTSNASSLPISSAEYDIITQLLSKIAELEAANKDIMSQAARTNERLDKAERDAEQIRQVYEGLELEVSRDGPTEEGAEIPDDQMGTIRHRSPRKGGSLRSTLAPSDSATYRKRSGSARSSKSSSLRGSLPRSVGPGLLGASPRGQGNKHISFTRAIKARKPLSQSLFAPPPSLTPRASRERLGRAIPKTPARAPDSATTSVLDHRSLRDGAFFTPGHANYPTTSSIISTAQTISSFAGSYSTRMVGGNMRTLSSELGSEFGDDWGHGGGNADFITDDDLEPEDGDLPTTSLSLTLTPPDGPNPGVVALQNALDPQLAGTLLEQDQHIVPLGGLRGAPGEAFFMLAKAVAARPNRWIESDSAQKLTGQHQRTISSFAHRQSALAHHQYQVMSARKSRKLANKEDPWEANRYPDPESDMEADDEVEQASRRKTRRDLALDRMALTIRNRHYEVASPRASRRRQHTQDQESENDEDQFEVIPTTVPPNETAEYEPQRGRYGPGALAQKLRRTWSSTLFEVWILLQAVIIIAAFVWTLSKKGPRAVVGAAEKKKY